MLFSNLFTSLPKQLRQLPETDRRFAQTAVNGVGFLRNAVEENLIPIVERTVGEPLSDVSKVKAASEYAIAILACCNIGQDRSSLGRDPELLREMMAMLVLAESDDKRNVLEQAQYSRNPDEAKIQVNLAVLRILGLRDSSLIDRLRGAEFTKVWYEIVNSFIPGMFIGLKRMPAAVVEERAMTSVKNSKSRSQAVLKEFISRVTPKT